MLSDRWLKRMSVATQVAALGFHNLERRLRVWSLKGRAIESLDHLPAYTAGCGTGSSGIAPDTSLGSAGPLCDPSSPQAGA